MGRATKTWIALITAGLVLAPALTARAGYDPTAFHPFGNLDPFACPADVVGTDGPDRLEGGRVPDDLRGWRGLSVLGLGGNDTLISKSGVRFGDCLVGGDGNDRLVGGDGSETLLGGNGDDRLTGGPGALDMLDGGDGADTLIGGAGADRLYGGAGPDFIRGGPGNDWIAGGAERNNIDAGPGRDKVSSANGIAETVRCGSGKDTAWADARDRLVGCERVHRIGTLYPSVSPGSGGPHTVFRTSLEAPFTTYSAAASAGYFYNVSVHPKGKGCARIPLPMGQDGEPGERIVVPIKSPNRGGFCRGLYIGTITFRSSDALDNCPTRREARLSHVPLDECDLEIVLGRFSFRVR